jgi:hypothetical protein
MSEELHDCGGCGVKPGEFHADGCDVECCARCGRQQVIDNCVYELNGISMLFMESTHPEIYTGGPTAVMFEVYDAEIEKIGGRLPWTGLWPGVVECREYDFWCVGPPWVSCSKDTPEATEDLNRLYRETRWDREKRRHVLRTSRT